MMEPVYKGSRLGNAYNRMIYIAIGANLPAHGGVGPLATCAWAVQRMAGWPGLRLKRQSPWYSSAPVPAAPTQPRFVNGVVALETWDSTTTPAYLLAVLHGIEAEAGRVRGIANAARVLDLDILDFDGRCQAAPDPVLPHPRAHERGFVLYPLRDVAPKWVHPRLSISIEALIATLPEQDLALLSPNGR